MRLTIKAPKAPGLEYRFRQLSRLALAGLVAVAGLSIVCPGAAISADAAPPAGVKAKPALIEVDSVSVVGAGDKVFIKAGAPLKYTVFKLTDPARIIVDIAGVTMQKITSPIRVDNNFITEMTVLTYGDEEKIGRVIIGLKDGVAHEVKGGENAIVVNLKPEVEGGVPVVAVAPQPPQSPQSPPSEEVALQRPEPSPKATAPEPTQRSDKPATKLVKLDIASQSGGTVVTVEADGLIGNYNSFPLENPARIVVDVWGVSNATGKKIVTGAENNHVKVVRFGQDKNRVRLVMDLSGKKSIPHVVRRDDNLLVVTISEGVRGEVAEAPAVVAAPAPAPKEAAPAPSETASSGEKRAEKSAVIEAAPKGPEINQVDFRLVGGKGRLTVIGTAKTPYTVKESDEGKTLVLDISDVTIREDLVRTLDAVKLATPVATVSSYQESFKPKDVRVLVKLNEKTPYEVKDEGGVITVEFASQTISVKTAVTSAVSPNAATQAAGAKEYEGAKIDLDMMDANINDVLRLLAEVSNINIIAADDVKGTISLRLKNVPWEQAFDIVLKSKGLDKVRDGNVIRVAPATQIRNEREADLAAKKAREKLENLEISFIAINYAVASDLELQVKGVLTERGSVTSEKRTNTIIVKDIKLGIEQAANLIKRLDLVIPQVLIEARIVEASTSFARDLGIQWGADIRVRGNSAGTTNTNVFGSSTNRDTVGTATSTAQTASSAQSFMASGVTNYAVNLPASGTAGPLAGLGFIFGKAGRNPMVLDLRLTAGESEGRVRTISRPRITTMDNKEAKIEQGESIPFATTSASGTATTFIDANLSLTVTPHITPDGSVLMKIKASRNSVGTFRTSAGEPSINKKESSTEVLVRDGETTVIGGIVVSDKSESEKGIPFLKDIPVIGWIFKNSSVSDVQTELLIFITPTIMKDKIVG